MKYLFLLFSILLFPTTQAQFIINFGGNNYYKAKVYLEDNTMKEGYLLDFKDDNVVSFAPQKFIENFSTDENKQGFKNKFYYFRETEKGKDEKIMLSDIKRIDLTKYNGATQKERTDTFEKVNLARVTNDLEIQSEDEFVLLPLYFSNSKISIYGYSLVGCDDLSKINCRATIMHQFYFKKQGDEYAIKPLDFNLFTIGKAEDKYYKSFEYFGKDCPEFLAYLRDLEEKNKSQESQKRTKVISGKKAKELFHTKEYDSYEKNIKKMKKKLDRKDFKVYEAQQKELFFDELAESFYDKMYNELIVTYINSCE